MLMRFGMGIVLTPEKQKLIEPIVKPCYAALGLANDYFSFDIEWEEFQAESDKTTMTNAVWLFMQWENLNAEQAKRRVQEVTKQYEQQYLRNIADFAAGEGKENIKLQTYLKAQGYQVPGNVAWSLRCPRYHPWLCKEAASLLHQDTIQELEAGRKPQALEEYRSRSHSESDLSDASPTFWSGSCRSSARSSVSSAFGPPDKDISITPAILGDEV